MSLIWRRIQRTNKKEYKFEFTVSYKSLRLACAENQEWKPTTLVVVWKRRGRRFRTEALNWPDVEGMTTTILAWHEDESHTADVMLFKEGSAKKFDKKDWEFSLENIAAGGQRKVVGSCTLNLVDCVEDVQCENEISLRLLPCTTKVKSIHLEVGIVAKFLHERKTSEADDLSLNSFTDDPAFEELRESDDEDSNSLSVPKTRMTVGGRRGSDQSESQCVMEHRKTVTTSRQKEFLQEESASSQEDEPYNTTPLSELPAMEIPGEEALLAWSRRVTNGYHGVQIHNMTTTWRNGMAFSAIIHRFRPELIDFHGLSPLEMLENNKKAFRAAEAIGVPRVLDPVELVNCTTPDKLSIMTYLFQLKIHLGNATDGMTTVSRYSQQNRDTIEQMALAEMCASEHSDSLYSDESEEDSDDSESSEYTGSDVEGDIVLATKGWEVKRSATQGNDPTADAAATAAADEPERSAEASVDDTANCQSGASGNAVNSNPELTQASGASPASSAVVATVNVANQRQPASKSMFAAMDDTSSDSSPGLPLKSQVQAATGLEDSDELEVFTTSSITVAESFQKANPAVHKAHKTPVSAKNVKAPSAGPKLTPNLADYKSPPTPDAVRKLDLLARAQRLVEEQERRTGVAFVSPSTHGVPSSSGPGPTTGARRGTDRQHGAALLPQATMAPMETDIDADLTCAGRGESERYNPFTVAAATVSATSDKTSTGIKTEDNVEHGEGRKKRKKRKKRKTDETETADGEKKKKKRKKKKKKKEKLAEELQAGEVATTGSVAVASTAKLGDSIPEDSVPVASHDAQKPRRTRPVRKPLPVSKPTDRSSLARDEVLRMRKTSAERRGEAGELTLQTAAVETDLQGWVPAQRSLPKSPTTDSDFLDTFEYAHYSAKTLEKQRAMLDKQGHRVERHLREAMTNGDQDATAKLMQNWFQLVAQKNILIRQSEDLDLLSKETELETRFELINRKLRQLMAVEDHKKSAEHIALEESLMSEMKLLLKQRDEVAQRLHEREIMAQQEDERVEQAISKTTSNKKQQQPSAAEDKPCLLM